MLSHKQYHLVTRIFLFLIIILIASQVLLAQDYIDKIVSINYPLVSDNHDFDMQLSRMLYDKLKSEGYEISSRAKIELLFTTTNLPDKNETVVNIIYMRSMPKEVMEYNIKNETMYAYEKDKTKLPKEGKFVREMITEEMLQNYRMASGYDSIIINGNNLEVEVYKIIEKAISRVNFLNTKQ